MATRMLIDATHPEETRVVVVRGHQLEEFDFESASKKQLKGNIYIAKITRVEPSLQAAFVEYGGNRHGFLAFSEIHPDYYQIPLADRQALLEEEADDHGEEEDDNTPEEAPAKAAALLSAPQGGQETLADEGGTGAPEIDVTLTVTDSHTVSTVGTAQLAHQQPEPLPPEPEQLQPPQPIQPIQVPEPADTSEPVQAAERVQTAEPVLAIEEQVQAIEEQVQAIEAGPEAETDSAVETSSGTGNTEVDQGPPPNQPESTTQGEADETDDKPGPQSLAADQDHDQAILEGDPETLEVVADAVASNGAARDGQAPGQDWRQRRNEEPPEGTIENDATEITADTTIESTGGEGGDHDIEEEFASARPRLRPRRNYKIQDVIKRRQIMLIQVVKEERGNKGAALTTYLSLAGRYSVLMPNSPRGGGISRKIQNATDRKRLKAITSELDVPKGMSVIVRTAGLNRTKQEIRRDYEYLLRMWDSVRELTLRSSAPTLVYEEGNLIKRTIRDLYNKDIEEILVEGEDGYRQAKDFMGMLIPSHAKNVQPYRGRISLFHHFQVEAQLDQMFNPTVHLKSGGYIVINPTEALVSIDVNSGRATREHNIEETATKTNLEAAEEIARQLRLRDLAGLVVIDFIDMEDQRNPRAVERKLKECLRTDRARIQIGRISPFGLLEMSRQRLRPGVLEASSITCPHCRGTGFIRSTESVALYVLRAVEEEGIRERASKLVIKVPPQIGLYILNNKRDTLVDIEKHYTIKIYIEIDDELIAPDYRIEKLMGRVSPAPEPVAAIRSGSVPMPALIDEDEEPESEGVEGREDGDANEDGDADADEALATDEAGDGQRKRRRRRRRTGKKGEKDAQSSPSEGQDDGEGTETEGQTVETDAGATEDEDGAEVATGDDDQSERRRRRRGRRGGRRRRGENDQATEDSQTADSSAPDSPTLDSLAPEDGPVSEEVGDREASAPFIEHPVENIRQVENTRIVAIAGTREVHSTPEAPALGEASVPNNIAAAIETAIAESQSLDLSRDPANTAQQDVSATEDGLAPEDADGEPMHAMQDTIPTAGIPVLALAAAPMDDTATGTTGEVSRPQFTPEPETPPRRGWWQLRRRL